MYLYQGMSSKQGPTLRELYLHFRGYVLSDKEEI